MKIRNLSLMVVSLFAFANGSRSHSQEFNIPVIDLPLEKSLDQIVDIGFPGVSVAIARKEGIVWKGASGFASVENQIKMSDEHLLGIGSITKVFVAVVVLQLAEEKLVDLDATPASILGETVKEIPNADKATLLQLLNHTSGIPTWEFDSEWIRVGRGDEMDIDQIWGKQETLKYLMSGRHPATNQPGEAYAYSNTNHTILGLIVEKATGSTIQKEIRKRILDPLGIKHIYLDSFEKFPPENKATGYHLVTQEFREVAGVHPSFQFVRENLVSTGKANLSCEWAAGGMVSTAQELAIFALALRDGKLLKPESTELMMEFEPFGYGRSLRRDSQERPYGATIGHSGGTLGYTAKMNWLEDGDLVVVFLSNLGVMHCGDVRDDIDYESFPDLIEEALNQLKPENLRMPRQNESPSSAKSLSNETPDPAIVSVGQQPLLQLLTTRDSKSRRNIWHRR